MSDEQAKNKSFPRNVEEELDKDEHNNSEASSSSSKEILGCDGLTQILADCKLENMFEKFISQDVNDEFLLDIDVTDNLADWNDLCKTLELTLGHKGKFKKALQKFQKAKKAQESSNAGKNSAESVLKDYTFYNAKMDLKAILVRFNIFEKLQKQAALGPLPKRSRTQLIHTFVEYTVQQLVWIAQKEFLDVFLKIKALFKYESIENYYNEGSKKSGNAFPGGQLFSHFKRRHEQLRKELGISRNRIKKRPEEIVELPSTLTLSEAENMRRELIGRQGPWDRILTDWEKTAPNRRNDMLALKVAGTIPRWPKYKKKQGIQLIEIDFKFLHKEAAERFNREWPDWTEKFVSEALKKAKRSKASEYIQNDFSNLSSESTWYDIGVVRALLYCLGQNRKSSTSKGLSKFDTIIQFIVYEENVMDLVKSLAENFSSNFYPFLIIAKLNDLPFKFYLSSFDIIYQFDSFSEALDCLVKSFFVFNVGYPKILKPFYTFIQQFIYGIYMSEFDIKSPDVIDLICALDRSRLPSEQT
ncbi:hypothetical protein ACFFRR_009973 [Megaselia abdita]